MLGETMAICREKPNVGLQNKYFDIKHPAPVSVDKYIYKPKSYRDHFQTTSQFYIKSILSPKALELPLKSFWIRQSDHVKGSESGLENYT